MFPLHFDLNTSYKIYEKILHTVYKTRFVKNIHGWRIYATNNIANFTTNLRNLYSNKKWIAINLARIFIEVLKYQSWYCLKKSYCNYIKYYIFFFFLFFLTIHVGSQRQAKEINTPFSSEAWGVPDFIPSCYFPEEGH